MEVRFCHNCGTKLKENTKFCGACGAAVLQLPEMEPEQEAVQPEVLVDEPVAEPVEVMEAEAVIPEPEPVVDIPEPEPEPATAEPEPVVIAFEPEPAVIPEEKPYIEPEVPAEPPVQEQPPVPQYQPPVQPVQVNVQLQTEPLAAPAKKKKDRYPARGVGRTILAVLLCFFIFLWSFAALAIFDVRYATSGGQLQENMNEAVESVDLTKVAASSVVSGVEDPDQSLMDWAAQKVEEAYSGAVEITGEDMAEFLKDSTVLPFLTEKLSATVNDVYNGTAISDVSREELENLMRENAELIEKATGKPLTEGEIDNLANQMEEVGITKILSASGFKAKAGVAYYGLRLSWWVIGFFGVLTLLFILFLAQTNKWNMLRTFGDVGITWAVLSCIMILAALFAKLLPSVWSSIFPIAAIGSIGGSVLFSGLIPALILLGVSVLLILIKIVGKLIVTKPVKTQV